MKRAPKKISILQKNDYNGEPACTKLLLYGIKKNDNHENA
jgi:hypothetical protein